MSTKKSDILQGRREPIHECKRLAPVSVTVPAYNICRVLFVETKPDPSDEKAELDDNIRTLEADNAHNGRERDIGHRQCLSRDSNA